MLKTYLNLKPLWNFPLIPVQNCLMNTWELYPVIVKIYEDPCPIKVLVFFPPGEEYLSLLTIVLPILVQFFRYYSCKLLFSSKNNIKLCVVENALRRNKTFASNKYEQ